MRLTLLDTLAQSHVVRLFKEAALLLSIAIYGCAGPQTNRLSPDLAETRFIFGDGEAAWVIDFQYYRSAGLLAHNGTLLRRCDTVDLHCSVADGWLLAPKRCDGMIAFVKNGAVQQSENINVVPIAMGRNRYETIFQGEIKSFTYADKTYQGFQGYVYNQERGIIGLIISTEDKIRGSSAQIDRVGLLRETRWLTNSIGLFPCSK
jgi:hypothetical protein